MRKAFEARMLWTDRCTSPLAHPVTWGRLLNFLNCFLIGEMWFNSPAPEKLELRLRGTLQTDYFRSQYSRHLSSGKTTETDTEMCRLQFSNPQHRIDPKPVDVPKKRSQGDIVWETGLSIL